ncbi:MAG: hypothetical protein WD426_04485 [Anditalea sp.]
MRSDEVTHAAEVQSLSNQDQYQNSRYGSDRHKDTYRQVHLTEGDLGIDSFSMSQEVSRGYSSCRKRAVRSTEVSLDNEGPNLL